MKITKEEYAELIRKHPHLNPKLRAAKQEQSKRMPLERALQRKDSSGATFEICFTIYAVRPLDWDNYWTKCLQDLLIDAGILHVDLWNVLQGKVMSKKANTKAEERTEVTITKL